jgi:hypothetical protein
MAILPGGQIDIVDVVVTHPARQDCLGQACTRAGLAAQRAEEGKVRAFRRFGDAGQYEFVPFALESYGRLGASAQSFLKRLGEVAAGRGNISKSAFVRSAYKEVSQVTGLTPYNGSNSSTSSQDNLARPRTNDSGHATTKARQGIKHYLSTHMVHQAMTLEYRD